MVQQQSKPQQPALVNLQMISPEERLLEADVQMVVMPAIEGYVGVLPGHAPMMIALSLGVVDVYLGGEVKDRLYISGGFADVTQEGCTLLVEKATRLANVDYVQLEASISNLENVVKNAAVDTVRQTAQEKLMESRIIKAAIDKGPAVPTYAG